MNEVYRLVGEILHRFQNIETYFTLSVYKISLDLPYDNNLHKRILSTFYKMQDKTFGQKLETIKNIGTLGICDDIVVLEYLRDKRNYVAHDFFSANEFNTTQDIETRKKELLQILQDTKIIEKAIRRAICDIR